MRISFGIIAAGAIALTGCQGMKYAMDNYRDTKVQSYLFVPNDGKPRYSETAIDSMGHTRQVDRAMTYRIFDKPDENRLMITPSLGASAGMGFAKGLTFGAVSAGPSPAAMREAAGGFLASTGRTCTADQIDLVAEPQYEVRYTCSPLAANAVTATIPARPKP